MNAIHLGHILKDEVTSTEQTFIWGSLLKMRLPQVNEGESLGDQWLLV